MSLVIRKALASDSDVAAELLTAQLVEHHLPANPEGVARGVALAISPGSVAWLLLAFRDTEPVAVFLANEIISVEKSGRVLWVEELYVTSSARRTGIARALLQHVATEARSKQIVSIELEVVPTQSAAFALYRSLGFIDVDRQRMTWQI